MGKQILGLAVMIVGALVTFLAGKIGKKLWHIEDPKNSLACLLLKFAGLGIAILGMLFIMDIL